MDEFTKIHCYYNYFIAKGNTIPINVLIIIISIVHLCFPPVSTIHTFYRSYIESTVRLSTTII